MTTLETERLIIRNFQANDWQALHKLIVQYQDSEFAPYDEQWPTSPEEIERITQWFASGDNFLAVFIKDSRQLIRFVGLNPEDEDGQRQFNIGYVFNSGFHGRGFATEACKAVLDRAFGELHADNVVTGTAAVNQPSCRLLERLGFHKSGEEMSSFKKAESGKPIEFLGYRYAISREEWEDRMT